VGVEEEAMDRHAHQHGAPADRDRSGPTAAQRARDRWGVDRVRLVHEPVDEDERDLARALQRRLRHLPVVMLHDRLAPGALLVEHLAVGPGGVTIVAGAGELPEPLRVERLHGIFGARAELLCDGAAEDRTALVAPVLRRVAAVREAIEDMAPVFGALCLPGDGDPRRLRSLRVEDVLIGGPKAVAALTARDGDLQDYELASLVDWLDQLCPPALG
jgi:hypothetical protein